VSCDWAVATSTSTERIAAVIVVFCIEISRMANGTDHVVAAND